MKRLGAEELEEEGGDKECKDDASKSMIYLLIFIVDLRHLVKKSTLEL